MNFTVDKKVIINLELTVEEFNTLFTAYGMTSHNDRIRRARDYNLNILTNSDDSHGLYNKLEEISDSIKKKV